MSKFQVFISFKHTDDHGNRTEDSLMAEKLYRTLENQGIKTFYSPISIAEKGEYNYSQMINHTLEECDILVAVATRKEHLNANWVNYEITTFHQEMLRGHKSREKSAMYTYVSEDVDVDSILLELRSCQSYTKLDDIVSSVRKRLNMESVIRQNFAPEKAVDQKIAPGTMIDGKYKILSKIGQGGMSTVYLAINERANKMWAVKVIRKDGIRDFDVVKQGLLMEIDLLKKLNHPNLPQIVDVIDREDDFTVIMDYIEGQSLQRVLKDNGKLEVGAVIKSAKQLCDVLGYLHSRSPAIIYRDMKPANIMLRPDGRISLIDFGTAREHKTGNVEDTTCLGTIGYAAPEQFGGMGQTDARTDIYGLGVTLYHLLTGKNPTEPPYEIKPIRQLDPQLPHGLEYIVKKCTCPDPIQRYQSAAEVLRDLERLDELNKKYRKKARTDSFLRTFGLAKTEKAPKPKAPPAPPPNMFSVPPKPIQPPTGYAVPAPPKPIQPPTGYAVPVIPEHPKPPLTGGSTPTQFAIPAVSYERAYIETSRLSNDSRIKACLVVTSEPELTPGEESNIRIHLITEKNQERMISRISQYARYCNFCVSERFYMDPNDTVEVTAQSNTVLMSDHTFPLTTIRTMRRYIVCLSPSAAEDTAKTVKFNGQINGKPVACCTLKYE